MFAIQIFVNVGMVIGIMPITGIPLPFLSYGGTAMLVNFVAIGILLERAHAALQVAGRVTVHRNVDPSGPVDSSTTSPSIAFADMRASVEPEPHALVRARVQGLGLLERLEDAMQRLGVDAGARGR